MRSARASRCSNRVRLTGCPSGSGRRPSRAAARTRAEATAAAGGPRQAARPGRRWRPRKPQGQAARLNFGAVSG